MLRYTDVSGSGNFRRFAKTFVAMPPDISVMVLTPSGASSRRHTSLPTTSAALLAAYMPGMNR